VCVCSVLFMLCNTLVLGTTGGAEDLCASAQRAVTCCIVTMLTIARRLGVRHSTYL